MIYLEKLHARHKLHIVLLRSGESNKYLSGPANKISKKSSESKFKIIIDI